MHPQDLYIKITPHETGIPVFRVVRVWNAEKWLATAQHDYAKDKENPSKVEMSSREEYLNSIKR